MDKYNILEPDPDQRDFTRGVYYDEDNARYNLLKRLSDAFVAGPRC